MKIQSKFITDPLNQVISFEPNTPDPKLLIKKMHPIRTCYSTQALLFHVYTL